MPVEHAGVRYERLVIQAGPNTFSLPLHPRLTVIAGVGELERESLIGELVGAFGAARSGVHAELIDDAGRHVAVFRPTGDRHRVVDVETAADVSGEFADARGRLDLLAHHGLDLRTARRKMRLGAVDLTASTHSAALIRALADCDQARLWNTAEAVRRSDEELQRTAEEVGSAPEDVDVVAQVEERHRRLEVAQNRHERSRRKTMFLAVVATLLAIPAMFMQAELAFPFILIASLSVMTSVVFRTRLAQAEKAEEAALAAAGAQSYLGFQIQRVNGLISDDQERRKLMGSASSHREAVAAWRDLAGEVTVEWALDRKEEILAAARLRRDVHALGVLSSTAPETDDDQTTALAQALVSRLAEMRHLGATGESFPLVLDDPFVGLEASMKPALLELLGHTAGSPQLIFLTEDEDVASWARLEALTGALTIVEPQPEQTARAPRRGRVAAPAAR